MGALAGLVAAVLFSLLATAVGAHKAVDDRVLKFSDLGAATIIFGVLGAFFAAVIGGWTAGRISGARRAEPAIHHGVAAWLVSHARIYRIRRVRFHGYQSTTARGSKGWTRERPGSQAPPPKGSIVLG